MNKEPLPSIPQAADYEAAVEVLAIDHAHSILQTLDLNESGDKFEDGTPIIEENILQLVIGCDSKGNDRCEDDLDCVEIEAYKLLCRHFGVEARGI